MYQTDARTGETIFSHKPMQPARRVFLVAQTDQSERRVQMQRQKDRWTTRLKLRTALFIYRFEVDGRALWDRDAGKVKFTDGNAWSLAVLSALPLNRAVRPRATAWRPRGTIAA